MYNYLFYKGYQLSSTSKNWNDTPVLGAMILVVPCIMFNLFTIAIILEGFDIAEYPFKREYKYPFIIVLVLITWFYYLYKDRYKRIINKYQLRENGRNGGLHPFVVFLIYYAFSFGILLLAALFKNREWIFSGLEPIN